MRRQDLGELVDDREGFPCLDLDVREGEPRVATVDVALRMVALRTLIERQALQY